MLESGSIFARIAAGCLICALCPGQLWSDGIAGGRTNSILVAEAAGALPVLPEGPAPRPPRLEISRVVIEQGFIGRSLTFSIGLDRPRPFRVFTLDAPPRLIIDLDGVSATGSDLSAVERPRGVTAIGVGGAMSGWTRLVADLARPFALDTAEIHREPDGPSLRIVLSRVGAEEFAARSGAPPNVYLGGPSAGSGKPLPIVIDPGHGGIDPGATRGGVMEKAVVLAFAAQLADALTATGRFEVILTRTRDDFLALGDRAALARASAARAFISIHVNAVDDPRARGGIVFTLSEAGSSGAARDRAAIENRADMVAGLPAPDPVDPVTDALTSLRHSEAQARSIDLAGFLVEALRTYTGGGTQAPLQSANFQVLRLRDIPAVLLELGFLSNEADRANLVSPEWRARAARAVAAALADWARAGGPLTRN